MPVSWYLQLTRRMPHGYLGATRSMLSSSWHGADGVRLMHGAHPVCTLEWRPAKHALATFARRSTNRPEALGRRKTGGVDGTHVPKQRDHRAFAIPLSCSRLATRRRWGRRIRVADHYRHPRLSLLDSPIYHTAIICGGRWAPASKTSRPTHPMWILATSPRNCDHYQRKAIPPYGNAAGYSAHRRIFRNVNSVAKLTRWIARAETKISP